jgi:glycerate-2-kinase
MRILNMDDLASHGNRRVRQHAAEILEAALQAADPYYTTLQLIRIEGDRLIVGNPDFEPSGAPRTGDEVFDLNRIGRILVVGAGKGVHRVAKAIEDVLGERLTGGHIIAKIGDEVDLRRIGYTYGAHPVPDEGCVEGCRRILEICQGLKKEDLVFTIAGNGVSALLTLPAPGISLEDVRRTTYALQIERGTPTGDLNMVRNHIDIMKGGRVTRYLQPATAIHLLAIDANQERRAGQSGWDKLIYRNAWLHFLPEGTTFQDAIDALHKWDAWEAVPDSVRQHLLRADPADETVKANEFLRTNFRIFGVMPHSYGLVPAAMRKARELGYTPHHMARFLRSEAREAGATLAAIAITIEEEGTPFETPCALFTSGELVVTVGQEDGVGGRNQEYAVGAALAISGSQNIVVGAVDSDGTDGPGGQFKPGGWDIPNLAGGIVDGQTVAEAKAAGVDLFVELRRHNTSPALWKIKSGIHAIHSISVNDLGVTLIAGRAQD